MTTRQSRARKTRRAVPPIEGTEQPSIPPPPLTPEQTQAVIDLLRSWRNASEEQLREQQETQEHLMKALDEERKRIGARLLFP